MRQKEGNAAKYIGNSFKNKEIWNTTASPGGKSGAHPIETKFCKTVGPEITAIPEILA